MSSELLLEQVLSSVETRTKKLENFLNVQNNVAAELKDSIKKLYDFTKEETNRKNDALPELVTQGFDEEQIWQQLELQNEAELTHFLTEVSRVLAGNKKLELPISLTRKEDEPMDDASSDEENESKEELLNDEPDDSDEEMDLDMDIDGKLNRSKKQSRKKINHPSIVDDKFFKLEELDEYLNKEDKKESPQGRENEEDDEESGDDESVDLFEPVDDDDDDDDDDDNESENGKMMKYADFFDSPDSADEAERGIEDSKSLRYDNEEKKSEIGDVEMEDGDNPAKKDKSKGKRVKFNLTNDSDDTDSLEIEKEGKPAEETEERNKSSLENRQERLQRRIEELEKEAMSEKPWQLKGEVTATNRPQNSLLEEYVEFDVTSRPAPVITEETTLKLEDIITRRIKDKAWDDVERKFKPVETPLEYKKKLVMDQEKSKKSLAQIYEDAYVKQREATNPDNAEREPEEPKEHIELREMMNSLFRKLDSLSNFHYTPKQAQPEVKIVSNLPAISMEEVAPIATTDATLLAPEEIKSKPRGELVGRAERTSTDMKRERRKKKMKQRAHQKASEQKEKSLAEKLKTGGKKYTKGEAAAAIKKLTKDRNIVKMDETSNKVAKSSTAFFTQLQDQVKSHIKSKTGNAVKKRDKNAHSAVKLKL